MTEDAKRAQVLLAGMSDEDRKSLEDLFFRQFPVISFQAVTPVPSTTVDISIEHRVALAEATLALEKVLRRAYPKGTRIITQYHHAHPFTER